MCKLGWSGLLAIGLLVTPLPAQRLIWLDEVGYMEGVASTPAGAVVVGMLVEGGAFRWTEWGGFEWIGPPGSWARGVSADGRVVVGVQGGAFYAFRWTPEQGMQNIASGGIAEGVSADGSTVVGWVGYAIAFRWREATGLQYLPPFPGGWVSMAYAASADGSVVVGDASNPLEGGEVACRWTEEGLESLGLLPGTRMTTAYGVSADGTVVVGVGYLSRVPHSILAVIPFRWTVWGGMEVLAPWSGRGDDNNYAWDVSGDGRVVVGERSGYERYGWRWVEGRGLEDLNEVYRGLLQPGERLLSANGISDDGRYIVGIGRRRRESWYVYPAGYVLDTWRRGDVNGDGCVDDSDLLTVLFGFGGTGYADVNRDGVVDEGDLVEVLAHFGERC